MSRAASGRPLCVSDVLQAPALDWSYAGGVLQPVVTFLNIVMKQLPSTPQEQQVRDGILMCVFLHVHGQLCSALTSVSMCAHSCCPRYSSMRSQMLLLSNLLNVLASYAKHLPDMVRM